jgi:hypothetical protein
MDMKIVKMVLVVLALSLLGAMLVPGARAQGTIYSKRTVVSFSQPVEVPGQVLPAGTYTIELLGDLGNRHIVRIFNADHSKVITTILAIPNWRLEPTGKTVMTFSERAADSPEALKAWFYPGDSFGQEFVYPKPRAIQLAQVTKEIIPAIPTETTNIEELKTVPIVAETPERKELPLSEVAAIQTSPPVEKTMVAQARTLPKTASSIPLIALFAMASLGFAFVLKRIAG